MLARPPPRLPITSTISSISQRRLVIRPPSRALSASVYARRWNFDYASRVSAARWISCSSHPFVLRATLLCARSTMLLEFARTYVGPRLSHRRDRVVHRLEEISDEASARVAARAFRAWAIAEGLLAEES